MFLVTSWSMESSYETPSIYGPVDTLEAVAELFGPGDCADNRHDEGTLYRTRTLTRIHGSWSEISAADVQTLKALTHALDPSYAERYGSPYEV